MNDEATIGARLRALRKWRGMTLAQLAGQAGLSTSFLSMAERGQRAIDRRSHIAALAEVLRVSETELTGGPHLTADRVQSDPHLAVPALRVALQTNTLRSAAVEHARPVRELADLVTGPLDQWRRRDDYISMGGVLPDILDELHVHVTDPKDEADQRLALQTLVEACIQTAGICKNLNYPDLAYFAACRCDEAARMLDDPVVIGQAAFPLVLNAPHESGWHRVLAMAEKAANALEPHVHDDLGIQVLGMLTLNAALAASAVLDVGNAEHWLNEAGELATRVPDNPDTAWQFFSATNVAVWQITVGVECGQFGGAIHKKAGLVDVAKLDSVPARKACYFADVGRGLSHDPKTNSDAVRWLRNAESVAPQRIRNNLKVRESVAVMLEQAKATAGGRELRGMAARMGVPH